jgi:transposase
MRDPDTLDEENRLQLKAILARCPELEAVRRHVGTFAHMIRDLRGDLLSGWTDRVRDYALPALHSFVTGLRQDLAAATAGLTLPWNNGPAEGALAENLIRAGQALHMMTSTPVPLEKLSRLVRTSNKPLRS